MTIVELFLVLWLLFAMACGAGVGAWFYGPLGFLGGAIAGFAAGPLLLIATIPFRGLLSPVVELMNENQQREARDRAQRECERTLVETFGDYCSPARRDEWLATCADLRPGDEVEGRWIASANSEVYFQIGVAFPARVYLQDGMPGPGRQDEVSLSIDRFDEDENVIVATWDPFRSTT